MTKSQYIRGQAFRKAATGAIFLCLAITSGAFAHSFGLDENALWMTVCAFGSLAAFIASIVMVLAAHDKLIAAEREDYWDHLRKMSQIRRI